MVKLASVSASPKWAFAGLLVLYAVLYGGLLVHTDFRPYVFDNNESFSAFNHARNLVELGVSESWGLADEAVGPSPLAHPVAHTHQGNMPRLFAALLYLTGVRTVEAQIGVTVFTVGVAVLALAFWFFRRCGGVAFATIACLLLMTDYLFFAQWQVNTYRIWIVFFVLSSLTIVEQFVRTRHSIWLLLLAVNSLFLFYYELSFVLFTATMTAIYAALRLWDDRFAILRAWLAMGVGGALSFGILIAQLIGYLGWDDLLTDIRLTYLARNVPQAEADALRRSLQAFYDTHNIAFFYNLAPPETGDGLGRFAAELIQRHIDVLTPFLTTLTVVALLGMAVRRAGNALAGRLRDRPGLALYQPTASAILAAAMAVFVLMLLWVSNAWSLRVTSTTGGWYLLGAAIAGVAAAAGGFGALRLGRRLVWPGAEGVARLAACAAFLLLASVWLACEGTFQSPALKVLWSDALAPPGRPLWQTGGLLCTALAWAATILLRPSPAQSRQEAQPALSAFFVSGAVAFCLMSLLFRGYALTGYLSRGETVLVCHLAAAFALALLGQARLARELVQRADILRRANLVSGLARHVSLGLRTLGAMAVAGVAAFAVNWIFVQAGYVRLLPPDQIAWIDQLAKPPLKGRSIVSNTYPIPFALTAGSWGYADTRLVSGGFELGPEGYRPVHSGRRIWLADAPTNPDYKRPALFVCFVNNSLFRVAGRLEGHPVPSCHGIGIIREMRAGLWSPFRHQIVAIDGDDMPAWAIVRLDWRGPPPSQLPSAAGDHRDTGAQPETGMRQN